jgi:hypothetical protein
MVGLIHEGGCGILVYTYTCTYMNYVCKLKELGSFKDLSIRTDSGKRLCFMLCYYG